MARRPRRDGPDTWHHAMNRTMARRTLFENDEDRRFFQSLLAREVRNGRLEIHAYSLMLTHFHLLVRSVNGQLSAAMRRIQNRYARRFNRTRKRDGSLFRGRFLSRRIDDLAYRRDVVTYIHDNAIAAGVAARAEIDGIKAPEGVDAILGHHFPGLQVGLAQQGKILGILRGRGRPWRAVEGPDTANLRRNPSPSQLWWWQTALRCCWPRRVQVRAIG